METKTCTKCGIEKDVSCFYKRNDRKCGFQSWCISCKKQYNKNNAPRIVEQQKQYNKDNAPRLIEWKKQWNKDNAPRIAEQQKQYNKNNAPRIAEQQKQWDKDNAQRRTGYRKQHNNDIALFEVYSKKLEIFEIIRRCPENIKLLEVKCTYCGKWTLPTNLQVRNRLQAFSGNYSGELRFYCSDACKQACPTYRQVTHWKGQKQKRLGTSREVDVWFRQLVLETDSWTCQICGRSKDEYPELVLHVHHTRGVAQQPMLQNDIAYAFTVCLDCHKEIHKKKGCTYFDLRRSKCKV